MDLVIYRYMIILHGKQNNNDTGEPKNNNNSIHAK